MSTGREYNRQAHGRCGPCDRDAGAKRRRTLLIRLAIGILLASTAGGSHAQQATWEGWGKPLADRVVRFVPSSAPGLIDRYPWESGKGPVAPWMSSQCDDRSCPYFPITVGREWRMADPDFVKQVRQLEHAAPAERLEDVQDRVAALVEQGRYDEARKLAASMGNLQADVMAADPSLQEKDQGKLAARLQTDEDRASKLKEERSRTLGLRIAVNAPPSANAKPVGTIKGLALVREPTSSADPQRRGAKLSVYLGPADFRNVPGEAGPRMRGVVKSILVVADTRSTRDHAQADEALARQMLEKVDYAGLAKLLQP